MSAAAIMEVAAAVVTGLKEEDQKRLQEAWKARISKDVPSVSCLR